MGKALDNEMSYKGLCINCAHRETCTLPKSEEEKFHCEEYECE